MNSRDWEAWCRGARKAHEWASTRYLGQFFSLSEAGICTEGLMMGSRQAMWAPSLLLTVSLRNCHWSRAFPRGAILEAFWERRGLQAAAIEQRSQEMCKALTTLHYPVLLSFIITMFKALTTGFNKKCKLGSGAFTLREVTGPVRHSSLNSCSSGDIFLLSPTAHLLCFRL